MSNNNPILKIGQEVLFAIGLYEKEEKLHKKNAPYGASYQWFGWDSNSRPTV